MHYHNGAQKIIEGQAHYWDSTRNGWVNPNNGFVLSEQQIQEMEFMMYNEDAYDIPQEVEYVFNYSNAAGLSGGTVPTPVKPGRGTKDYNRVRVEVISNGASGGEVLVGTAQDKQPTAAAGGGGAGAYAHLVYKFNRAVDISGSDDLEIRFRFPNEMHFTHGTTIEVDSPHGDIVGRIFPGSVGNTMPKDIAATGGTGAWSANPAATYFTEVTVTEGGAGGVTSNVGGFTLGGAGGVPSPVYFRGLDDRGKVYLALAGNGGATGNPRGTGEPREGLSQSFTDVVGWGFGGGGGVTANMNISGFETSGVTRGQAGSAGGVKVTWYHVDRVSP
tara:strand:+ start:254 stop:1246 length:993 start_codon:yes stop_codon:yes gene_type:complete